MTFVDFMKTLLGGVGREPDNGSGTITVGDEEFTGETGGY